MNDYSTLNSASTTGAGSGLMNVFWLAFYALMVVGMWKTFTKAGKPGWAAIVPIYNIYIITKIAGRPGWWTVLLLLPLVNIVVGLIVAIDLAKSYGRSTAFGVIGLWLFTPIGAMILGFSDAKYVGPAAAETATPPMTPPAAPSAPTQV